MRKGSLDGDGSLAYSARCCFSLLWVMFALIQTACAVTPPVSPFPKFRIIPGRQDAEGMPLTGARLCLLTGSACYQLPVQRAEASEGVVYQFGLEPAAKRLATRDGGSLVLFSATFSGGGSGTLDELAILRSRQTAHGWTIENLLPYVGLTNVSDREVWNIPALSSSPILLTADFVWGEGEIHFGSHFFQVNAWEFDPGTDRYERVLSYRTQRKYDGGDSAPVRVITPERGEILRRLKQRRPESKGSAQ